MTQDERPAELKAASRLAALDRSGLLDSPAEAAFDRLTRLAARLLGVPVASMSLVDDHRQFFKSQVGLADPWASTRETPLTHSFCQHVVATDSPLVVTDARTHPILAGNPAIAELNVVAYAGVPLTTADGQTLGSFCAIDGRPRDWTAREIETLRELAAMAMTEVALQTALRNARDRAAFTESEHNERLALLNSTNEGIVGIDPAGCCTFVNRAAAEMLGWSHHELTGASLHELMHHTRPDGSPYPATECAIRGVYRAGREIRDVADLFWRRDGTSFPVHYSCSPVKSGDDGFGGAVITFVDVTERRRAERRVQVHYAVSVALAEAQTEAGAGEGILRAVGEALDWKLGTL